MCVQHYIILTRYKPILFIIKRRHLTYFGHLTMHDYLAKMSIEGMVEEH